MKNKLLLLLTLVSANEMTLTRGGGGHGGGGHGGGGHGGGHGGGGHGGGHGGHGGYGRGGGWGGGWSVGLGVGLGVGVFTAAALGSWGRGGWTNVDNSTVNNYYDTPDSSDAWWNTPPVWYTDGVSSWNALGISGKLDQISSQIDGLKQEIQKNNSNKDAKQQLSELKQRYAELQKVKGSSSSDINTLKRKRSNSDDNSIRKDLKRDEAELDHAYQDLKQDI